MRILDVVIAGAGLFLVSCASNMSVSDLSMAMMEHSQESKNDLYYQGSDEEFDYFVADRHMADKRMKVPRGEVKIERRFDKIEDSSYWVQLTPYYPHGVLAKRAMPSMMDETNREIEFGL